MAYRVSVLSPCAGPGLAAGSAADPVAVRLARLGSGQAEGRRRRAEHRRDSTKRCDAVAELLATVILRNGNDFTLSGILPDLSVKDSLLATLRATLGPTVNLIDKIDTAAGATAPGFDGLAGLLDAATGIPNFQFTAEGGAVTLTGTAPSEQVKAAVEAAARRGWPNVQIINNIAIAGAAPSCENLQATIDANLAAPMKFQSGSATVTPDGRQQMLPVISAVRDCPGTELTVIGHTDNTGDDAINDPLSENRAAAVAAYLVSQGVPADSVTSQGAGSAEPIADNDTEAGRAQNRRTEIMVN